MDKKRRAKKEKFLQCPVCLARQIIERGLNVRNTEDAVRRIKNSSERRTVGSALSSAAQNAVIRDIQNKGASKLNASVSIQQNGRRGKIVVEYLDESKSSRYNFLRVPDGMKAKGRAVIKVETDE